MALSSFSKSFILNSESEVNSLIKALDNIPEIEINKNIISDEKEKEGELRLKQILDIVNKVTK